ncbi:MAG: 2-C-methyl-D-erythritol 4-phosphate cytidylyltransferase [Clostridiales bacterium]|nr:2-C-methyl-D-erythritol 4-phosphate cytidylyltransferase [Clostridiales bacterium]
MDNLTQSETGALQRKSLEAARYFRDFCEQHHLLSYFCGGCCIGAIRHRGFVPWDDDVDFFMPRGDYETLKAIWNREADTSRYVCVCSGPDLVDHNLFLTIRDVNTTFIKPYQQDLDIPHGVVLDILPLDGCPDSRFRRRIQKFWALVYSIYCAQLVPENHGGATALAGRLLLGAVPSRRLRYRIWRFAERQMTRYPIADCSKVTELCSGPHYMQNEYPAEWFRTSAEKEFEGEPFRLPAGYDSYLRMVFGDYMCLPPEEQRVAPHEALFMDLNHSYLEYKGKYYCRKEDLSK